MTSWNKYKKLLNTVFEEAKRYYENNDDSILKTLKPKQIKCLKTLIENIETQKSVVAVTITSLLKKIESPNQDIRLHREEFKGGYSGRSLDTNVVTPWLKEKFPRFAPKESGWLTRSIEQPSPFTKDFPGKIRNKSVKNAFLSILDEIEKQKLDPKSCLLCLLFLLLRKHKKEMKIISKLKQETTANTLLTIDRVINMLKEHFSIRISSRLPVIAIYSIYQILVKNIKLYKNKTLLPLKIHTTSDRYTGFGDIEICNPDNTPFEIVEIKHKIPIDKVMVEDILKKVKGTTIRRYYILTTAEPNFKGNESEIFNLVGEIKSNYNIEIIPNGILISLKYYLRFIPELKKFLDCYTNNLKKEFKKTTDIKEIHITKWSEIRKKYNT